MGSIEEEEDDPIVRHEFEDDVVDRNGHRDMYRGKLKGYSFRPEHVTFSTSDCSSCGERPRFRLSEDKKSVTVDEPCTETEFTPYVTTVPFASGYVLISDQLATEHSDEEDMASYNSIKGRRQYALAMEQEGVARGAAIDVSVSMILNKDTDELLIVELQYDDEEEHIIPPGFTYVGHADGAVWAYEMIDAKAFKTLKNRRESAKGRCVVAVKPGNYEFTHYSDDPRLSQNNWGEYGTDEYEHNAAAALTDVNGVNVVLLAAGKLVS